MFGLGPLPHAEFVEIATATLLAGTLLEPCSPFGWPQTIFAAVALGATASLSGGLFTPLLELIDRVSTLTASLFAEASLGLLCGALALCAAALLLKRVTWRRDIYPNNLKKCLDITELLPSQKTPSLFFAKEI